MKKEKEKTYAPPKIKIFDIKELLEGFDSELFLVVVSCGPAGSPFSPVGNPGTATLL